MSKEDIRDLNKCNVGNVELQINRYNNDQVKVRYALCKHCQCYNKTSINIHVNIREKEKECRQKNRE